MRKIAICLLVAFMALGIRAGNFITPTEVRITGVQIWDTPIDTEYVLVTHSNSNGELGAMDDMLMFIRTMDGERFFLRSVGSQVSKNDINYWYVFP